MTHFSNDPNKDLCSGRAPLESLPASSCRTRPSGIRNARCSARWDINPLTQSTTSALLADCQQPSSACVCLRFGLYDLLGSCSSTRLCAPAATRLCARSRPCSSSTNSSTRLCAPATTRICARGRPQSARCCPHRPRSNEYPRGQSNYRRVHRHR